MYPNMDRSLVPKEYLRNKMVYDLVYNPVKTKLLREADAAGCATISGIEMFLHQAAEQFSIWTEMEAPIDVMRNAALGCH
jgi:shikimate 5-dehydrogenase